MPFTAPSGAAEGVVLLDGREVAGKPAGLKDGALILEGRDEPLPLYELSAIVFAEEDRSAVPPADITAGPIVVFRGGELLSGRIAKAGGRICTIQVGEIRLEAPTEGIRAFRLREANAADDLFEADLKSDSAPAKDVVYVRRGGGLLRVEGVFQSLDDEFLTLEYEGAERRLKRQLVLGVLLGPVASRGAEAGFPAIFELEAGGQFPAYLTGLSREGGGRLSVRFRGSPPDSAQALELKRVARIKFASDRVLLLSSVDPAIAEETPLLGSQTPFPFRRDLAVTGGALKLGGKTYRKGLGVHSRSALEYDIQGRYKTFSSVIGLDDAATPLAAVTFRIEADGKEIFKKDFSRASRPETVLLPVEGVKRLRLVVDFGEDGADFGDHADWADARVAK